MKLLALMKKEFTRFFRDPRLIISMLLPGILIYIIYSVMGAAIFSEEEDYSFNAADAGVSAYGGDYLFFEDNLSGVGDGTRYETLKNIVSDVTILTDGKTPQFALPCDTRKIDRLEGDAVLREVVFSDGTRQAFDGIFVACGSAGAFEFAKKLGLETQGNKIRTDENCATNIPGIYAAGDCTPGMQQIAKAVYDGMLAGIAATKYLKK